MREELTARKEMMRMCAKSQSEKKVSRKTFRFTEAEIENLEQKATALGVTQSEYIRMLLELPIQFESDSSGYFDAEVVERDGEPHEPGGKLILYTSDMYKIAAAVNKWGVNYNQSVAALNRIAKAIDLHSGEPGWLADERTRSDMIDALVFCRQETERAYKSVRALNKRIDGIGSLSFVPLRIPNYVQLEKTKRETRGDA